MAKRKDVAMGRGRRKFIIYMKGTIRDVWPSQLREPWSGMLVEDGFTMVVKSSPLTMGQLTEVRLPGFSIIQEFGVDPAPPYAVRFFRRAATELRRLGIRYHWTDGVPFGIRFEFAAVPKKDRVHAIVFLLGCIQRANKWLQDVAKPLVWAHVKQPTVLRVKAGSKLAKSALDWAEKRREITLTREAARLIARGKKLGLLGVLHGKKRKYVIKARRGKGGGWPKVLYKDEIPPDPPSSQR